MKKIGISARIAIDSSERSKNYRMVAVADNYVKSVLMAGAVPLVLPVVDDINVIEEQLKLLDGLILSGGEDVNPTLYGEEHLIKNGVPSIERDTFDLALIKKAIELKIPILGICRGCQILNVAAGGTLYQDLSYKENITLKHDQFGNHSVGTHKVQITENSFLGELYGNSLWVNSFHHQAVKELAPIFEVSALSSDNVIEAYESRDKRHLMMGIQWHPEMMTAGGDKEMLKIFEKFILKI